MIEFQNVSVCYDPGARHPVYAIENISLKIESGDWVFLVGPSGAGKSSLLKLLHCSLPAGASIEGKILLEGQDITRLSNRDIPFVRRRLGVVFQDFQLLAQKTAWENVAFALRVIGTPQNRISREVPRALDIVGLAHRAHAQPHELSGGEQQRIAIARAIVNNPTLLLADEPTGNLDPDTAAGIADVLRRINEERGTTVVMATHDRHLVDTMRRRVVRVRDGKIASDEAQGVYHPEDDEPTPPRTAPTASPENATQSTPQTNNPVESTPAASTPERRAPRPVAAHRSTPTGNVAMVSNAASRATPIETSSPVNAPAPRADNSENVAPEVLTSEVLAPEASASEISARVETGAPDEAQSTPRVAGEVPRARLRDPQDAITRDALGNQAPLGSDENPIVQYGRN